MMTSLKRASLSNKNVYPRVISPVSVSGVKGRFEPRHMIFDFQQFGILPNEDSDMPV